MSVIVFGSINMDLVARTPRIPAPGETLTGHGFAMIPGGKGANQAVAVARLGVPTQMVGRAGSDSFGQDLVKALRHSGVGCDRVTIDDSTQSGIALITVEDTGENNIVIIPGANGRIDESDLERLKQILPSSKVLMLQLEIPLLMVVAAARAAKAIGVTVILDPAPARSDLPDELYSLIDILTPNQVEASQLAGIPVTDLESAAKASAILYKRGIPTVITKLGEQGSYCITEMESFCTPAFPVESIDTVAAGDCFNGGLAAGLAHGMSLRQAIAQATAAAALSVTKAGAQPSLPTQAELAVFLARQPFES
ncbi:MAG: ribokinase [Drouetiella hepatica Uher 2000/2452]|jgi:ribokinase|uniref:Ribokinase n=1 Tax=Drouetiella hepatica Uher 2000/2452 TaxID=904376 RepID=A0A951QAQ2_9CYAN|nr:ribokinase [Drouetiella hepatica Uher 2000/2452]